MRISDWSSDVCSSDLEFHFKEDFRMSYRLDYSANHPEQIVQDGASVAAPAIRYVEVPRRGFTFPSILKTTAVFLTGAAALFTWETAAPEGYRISPFMGTYDARIAAAVNAAELQHQSRFDSWAANVKLAADQQRSEERRVGKKCVSK